LLQNANVSGKVVSCLLISKIQYFNHKELQKESQVILTNLPSYVPQGNEIILLEQLMM